MKALTTSSAAQQDAFATFIQQNEEAIFDLCCYLLDDVAAADAMTQQVLVDTFPRCSEVARQELLEIACRYCLSSVSSLTRQLSHHTRTQSDDCCLQRLLETLSPESRAILLLHDRYGFPNKEIANVLNLDIQDVRQRLYQARHQAAAFLLRDSNLNNITVHFDGNGIAKSCHSRDTNYGLMTIDHDTFS